MSVRKWGLGIAATLLLALVAVAQPAMATPESPDNARNTAAYGDLDTYMSRLMELNPGGKLVAENRIEFDNGVSIWMPTSGDVSAQGVEDCVSGHQCGWVDINFNGPGISASRCVYLDYTRYFFQHPSGAVDDFAYDVTAVFNNMPGVQWSQFWSPANNRNYNAHVGAPEDYVGAQWNDTFTAAQGCSGQAQ